MNLSANFTLLELTKSEAAIRLDIDNTPNEEQIESLRQLNSSPAVGGSKTSDHCKGQAVDFEIDGLSNPDVAQWIMDNLEYTQLILEFYVQGQPNSGWIHCSFDPNNLKKQELTATKIAGKTTYLQGLVA